MAEYIEREAVMERVKYEVVTSPVSVHKEDADVVEVVRCKDCVNGTVCSNLQGAEYVDCNYDDYIIRKPMDFCSYGERRDNDATD